MGANQIGLILQGRYGANPLGRYVGVVDDLAVHFRPVPAVKKADRPPVLPTFFAGLSRSGPPKAQSEQPVLCTRVPLRAAADRQNRSRNNRNCVRACRCGPRNKQPEKPKLCIHATRRGYNTGTRRNTGTNHLIEQKAPDGSGPGHAIERRGYTCRWATGFRGYPSGPLPSVRKPHAGLRGSYSDGANQTDRCKSCAARSRSSLLRSAKSSRNNPYLCTFLFRSGPRNCATLSRFVPLRSADSG